MVNFKDVKKCRCDRVREHDRWERESFLQDQFSSPRDAETIADAIEFYLDFLGGPEESRGIDDLGRHSRLGWRRASGGLVGADGVAIHGGPAVEIPCHQTVEAFQSGRKAETADTMTPRSSLEGSVS